MKGYTIQHSIELLEKAVKRLGGGSGGGSTAAEVSYSNTSSGLLATNVQSAIDEINLSVDGLKAGHTYSTTEAIVGKWIDGRDVYEKVVSIGPLPNATGKDVPHGIVDLDYIISLTGMAHSTTTHNRIQLSAVNAELATNQVVMFATDTDIKLAAAADRSSYDVAYAIVRYVKTATASTTNSRSKKSK